MKKILTMVMLVVMMLTSRVYALNVYITPDKYKAEVDETITFTVTVEGGDATVNVDGQDEEFTADDNIKVFKRSYGAPGEYRFSVSFDENTSDYVVVEIVEKGTLNEEDDNNTENPGDQTEENNPGDVQEPEKSDDARLSSLTLKDTEGDNIYIPFDSSTTTYDIDLTSEDTQMTIEAVAWDEEHATVQGNGLKRLTAGKNVFEIIVTAEDGKTKQTYTINVNVEVVPVTYLTFDGEEYGLMKELKNVNGPDGFKSTTMTINQENVTVFKDGNMILVYGLDSEGQGSFMIYREEDGIIGHYNPLSVSKKTVYLIDVPTSIQNREGLKYERVQILDKEVRGWTFNDEKLLDYVLIYGLNEDGEEAFFVYDGKNAQLLDYPESNPTTYKEFNEWLELEKKDNSNMVLYISIAAVVLVVAGVGYWMYSKNKKEDQEEIEESQPIENVKKVEKKEPVKPVKKVETKKVVKTEPVVVEEEEDDQWLTDHFYKTIIGDDDEEE